MRRRILRTLSLALLVALAGHLARAQQEPDQQTKVDALKLGYALNGNSMVRWGSIDLTSLVNPYYPYIKPAPDFIGPPRPSELDLGGRR